MNKEQKKLLEQVIDGIIGTEETLRALCRGTEEQPACDMLADYLECVMFDRACRIGILDQRDKDGASESSE